LILASACCIKSEGTAAKTVAPPHLEDAGREKTVTVLDGLPVERSVKVD